jgi:hypothetical protein
MRVLIINYRPSIVKRKAETEMTDICSNAFPTVRLGFGKRSEESRDYTGCSKSPCISFALGAAREHQEYLTCPFVVAGIISSQVLISTEAWEGGVLDENVRYGTLLNHRIYAKATENRSTVSPEQGARPRPHFCQG